MTVHSEETLWHPLLHACLAYSVIGYSLFFATLLLPSPDWAKSLIEYFIPIVNTLNTAARVAMSKGIDPFPSQSVILYCAFGSIILTGWSAYWIFSNKGLREAYRKKAIEKKVSRLKLIGLGIGMSFFSISCYPLILFIMKSRILSWRDFAFLSPTISSTTYLICGSFLPMVTFYLAICSIYSAVTLNYQTGN